MTTLCRIGLTGPMRVSKWPATIALLTAVGVGGNALPGASLRGTKASAHTREASGTLAPTLGTMAAARGRSRRASAFDGDERRPKRDVRVIRRELRRHAPGTYIDEMLLSRDSSLARWPERRSRPIRVWIQPSSNLRDWTASYIDEAYAAFDEWDALDLPVSFTYVADSVEAEVRVTWIGSFKERITGRTVWTRNDDWWITDASIILALRHRSGHVLDEDSMRAVALHEIGHMLGLDHTSDVHNIMAPKVHVRALSEADKATVRLLYSLPAGGVR